MKLTITGLGTITANRAVLNHISIMAGESAYRHRMLGCYATAEGEQKIRDEIYEALEASGYYKDLGTPCSTSNRIIADLDLD